MRKTQASASSNAIKAARKEATIVLSDNGPFSNRAARNAVRYCAIKCSNWNLKVPRICKSSCANGTEFGQAKMTLAQLTNITSG